MSETWQYREMGSRDKKTKKLKYYIVRQFRRFSACKHMKRLQEKTGHLEIK